MERSRSGEDVSSSDESDPERHMSDNSGSTKPETESNLKNVMVLLRRDVHKNDGKVYLPNAKEMTQLKRPEREQYKTGIKLTWNMTEKNVDEELRRRFPILGNNGRLSCATAADKGTRLEFHNSQGKVWDGSKINRLVRGNRVLYVLFEETSESVCERPDCSPQLQTPTHEPMGKKSRKRRNDGSASAAVCKRTKECSVTVVSSIGNSSIPMQLCRVNGRQNGPQGHSSTITTTISQKNVSSQNFFLDRLSKATGSQRSAIPVTYTCTRTSSTIGPGHQTQASGGILPPAHPPVSMSSSPYLNFSMQTSVQGCQSQSIVSRAPRQIQYHFVQDDLTVGKDILTLSQQGNSIPVADQTELQKQIQTELDQQYVLQNRNSFLPGTTQSAGSNMITLDSGNIWQRSVPAHPTVGSQWGPQASVPSQSQIGQGQSPSTCLVYNEEDTPISQETQTSGTSLTESGILHNDPSKQTAATADPPPISHESDSGLSSTRNNDVGVAIASNSADQSEDTSTLPETFSSSEDGESALEEGQEIWFENQTCGVVEEIFPSSGPILEDIRFCITLALKLPRKYRKLKFKANFEGIGAVPLRIQTGNATLTGKITSHVAGKVKVTVEYEGSNGNSIGFTFFEFIKKNDLVILGELSEVKLGQSVIYNALMNATGTTESSGSGIQEATLCGAGGTGVSNVTKRSYALPGKILTLLVYKAAEINDREFLEMVFNTSAGRVVFNYYRKSSTLPGDVARANGHIILGDFLEDVNERLSKEVCSEDGYEIVNWLELKYAVEKKVCLPCTDAAQLVNSPDGDDNQSDYEADDEASLLPSPADANANGGELDDSEHGDIGQITLDKNDSRDSIATEAESQRHQTGTERQAEGGSLFTNRDDSEMEMESLSHGTDNVEIKSNPRVSYADYSEKSVVNSAQDAVTNVALHPNQEGADPTDDHFVSSAVMSVAGETSNAIELSSEGGANSSAERQNQEPTDRMTISLPCEINTGRSHKAKNTTS